MKRDQEVEFFTPAEIDAFGEVFQQVGNHQINIAWKQVKAQLIFIQDRLHDVLRESYRETLRKD